MRLRKRFKNDEKLALALGLTQQSVSAIARGKYVPSEKYAKQIAMLEGTTLEEMVGPYGEKVTAAALGHEPPKSVRSMPDLFSNLDVCVHFYRSKKQWKPWTIAAARAGIFGAEDLQPPEWHDALDALEAVLATAALSPRRT